MTAYSQWFFSIGWLGISAIGGVLAITRGLVIAYLFVIPCVVFAIAGKS